MKTAVIQYIRKVRRFLLKKRLHPIRVFLFHQVSETFDESTMIRCDWTNLHQMQAYILALKKQYQFIPLDQAYSHISRDIFRRKNYAVLTSDDGWASLKNILPWLHQQKIPITLFLNPTYMDGQHFRERNTERYLKTEELPQLIQRYPSISVAMHGLEHISIKDMSEEQLRKYIEASITQTSSFSNYIPFWAYTWGKRSEFSDKVLHEYGIIPVYIDAERNINDASRIHRELLDGGEFLQ